MLSLEIRLDIAKVATVCAVMHSTACQSNEPYLYVEVDFLQSIEKYINMDLLI